MAPFLYARNKMETRFSISPYFLSSKVKIEVQSIDIVCGEDDLVLEITTAESKKIPITLSVEAFADILSAVANIVGENK